MAFPVLLDDLPALECNVGNSLLLDIFSTLQRLEDRMEGHSEGRSTIEHPHRPERPRHDPVNPRWRSQGSEQHLERSTFTPAHIEKLIPRRNWYEFHESGSDLCWALLDDETDQEQSQAIREASAVQGTRLVPNEDTHLQSRRNDSLRRGQVDWYTGSVYSLQIAGSVTGEPSKPVKRTNSTALRLSTIRSSMSQSSVSPRRSPQTLRKIHGNRDSRDSSMSHISTGNRGGRRRLRRMSKAERTQQELANAFFFYDVWKDEVQACAQPTSDGETPAPGSQEDDASNTLEQRMNWAWSGALHVQMKMDEAHQRGRRCRVSALRLRKLWEAMVKWWTTQE